MRGPCKHKVASAPEHLEGLLPLSCKGASGRQTHKVQAQSRPAPEGPGARGATPLAPFSQKGRRWIQAPFHFCFPFCRVFTTQSPRWPGREPPRAHCGLSLFLAEPCSFSPFADTRPASCSGSFHGLPFIFHRHDSQWMSLASSSFLVYFLRDLTTTQPQYVSSVRPPSASPLSMLPHPPRPLFVSPASRPWEYLLLWFLPGVTLGQLCRLSLTSLPHERACSGRPRSSFSHLGSCWA